MVGRVFAGETGGRSGERCAKRVRARGGDTGGRPGSAALGIELGDRGEGFATVRMRVTGDMVNGHGTAHGGYLFLSADTAFACPCNSHGPVTGAAGADITFVAPVWEGEELLAVAQERVRYGRSGVYDVTVLRGEQAVAEFRGRSRTIKRR